MTERQADERITGQTGDGTTLRRRGILAAAGAAVAAILAKQAAQPVAASGGPLTLETTANSEASGTGLVYTGLAFATTSAFAVGDQLASFSVPQGAMIAGVSTRGTAPIGVWGSTTANNGTGVFGESDSSNGYGVFGYSYSGNGVFGHSSNNHAVYGETNAAPGSGVAGVFGIGNNGSGNFGVVGDGSGGAAGTGSVGVQGQGAQYGVVGKVNNAANTVAVYGKNTSTGAGAIGVYGVSPGIAVYGLSSGSFGVVGGTTAVGGYGGYFATSANNSFGLRAEVQGAATGSYGLYATAPAGSKAAYFTGDVYINGSLTVADMTQKHGLLRGPDGAHHLMYTVEAPESWAEDFGTGTLTNGTATVTIDPLFASLIHTDDYHVFVVSHDGGSKGLAVTGRHADRFAVTEHGGGTSTGTFSWRLVGKPKGGKVERLGTYAVPAEPPPAPPLPKVPEPPVVPTVAPPKKP